VWSLHNLEVGAKTGSNPNSNPSPDPHDRERDSRGGCARDGGELAGGETRPILAERLHPRQEEVKGRPFPVVGGPEMNGGGRATVSGGARRRSTAGGLKEAGVRERSGRPAALRLSDGAGVLNRREARLGVEPDDELWAAAMVSAGGDFFGRNGKNKRDGW
jgi:hypothetical protein